MTQPARKSLDVRLRRSKAEPAFAGMTVSSSGRHPPAAIDPSLNTPR
ncbi:hypothetical protein [Lysobacter gummosus]